MSGPLAGVRVLDLAGAPQGWQAAAILADLGAQVYLAEVPGAISRDNPEAVTPTAAYRDAHHRGKQSLPFSDPSHPSNPSDLLALAETVDIIVETHPSPWPGGWALGPVANPRVIRAIASGYGLAGPLAGLPANEITAQAAGGLMSVTGLPGDIPLPVGAAVATRVGAMLLAYGAMLALTAREQTGLGQTADVSLLGGQILLQSWEITDSLITGRPAPQGGRSHQLSALASQIFPASDGHLVITASRIQDWGAFCRALGLEAIEHDPRFTSPGARSRNRLDLMALMSEATARRPIADLVAALRAIAIPCAPVNRYPDLARDPQLLANGYLVDERRTTNDDGSRGGDDRSVILRPALPIRFSGKPTRL